MDKIIPSVLYLSPTSNAPLKLLQHLVLMFLNLPFREFISSLGRWYPGGCHPRGDYNVGANYRSLQRRFVKYEILYLRPRSRSH